MTWMNEWISKDVCPTFFTIQQAHLKIVCAVLTQYKMNRH